MGVSALVYSPKLANGELPERYAFSRPLSDLAPGLNDDLSAIAAANGNVDLPVRISSKTAADGQSEVFVALADGITVPSKVRVVAATFNAQQNVYSVTTEDVPPRTLTWTPIVDPGNNSTTSPAGQPTPTVYTGATVAPVTGRIDAFPGLAEAGFNDFITVFPAGSGLPPIYVMFSEPLDSGRFTRRQLEKKYKHAGDFGVTDTKKNYSTLTQFRNAIEAHLANKDTVEKGTYRRDKGSKVYFNLATMNVVILKASGEFLSAWKINQDSESGRIYLETGDL